MSFNGAFNKNAGLTLPSFTNVQPTVSVSDVAPKTTNSTAVVVTEPSFEQESNDSHNASTNTKSDVEHIMESILHKNKSIKNDKIEEQEKEQEQITRDDKIDEAERANEIQFLESDSKVHEAAEELASPVEPMNSLTLDELIAARRNKIAQPIATLTMNDTSGKGELLDEESEEEETVDENVRDLESNDKLQLPIKERDQSETDDEASLIDEKQGLIESNVSNTNEFSDEFYPSTINVPKEIPFDETLDNVAEDEIISNPVNEKIDKEIENDVIKINTNESIHSTETEDQLKMRKISRHNSIKDIPNPPTNLKKQQAFDFQTFLAQFKSKDCQPAHKYLRSFLVQFNQRVWTVEEQIKLLKEFQEFLFNKLIQYKPFNEMDNDEIKINNCKEGLEKLIMTRVYNSVFSPSISFIKLTNSHKQDKFMDKKCLINCYLYDWIEFKHLDININNLKIESNFITLAAKQLSKIDDYKSPRDKIVCILNSSKVIFGLIRQQEQQEENADSFVPLLIYVLLYSKVKHLYSNLQYIERFRNQEFLIGETSYYVSTMQIACNFIINITQDQLTITEDEYNEQIKQAKLKMRKSQQEQQQLQLQQQKNREETPSQVLTKSAEMVKQSLSNSFNSFLQNIAPEPENDNQNENQPIISRERRRAAQNAELEAQLEHAKALSLEEEQHVAHVHEQEQETVAQLCAMFPAIDREIIADVVASAPDDVGGAVNALLALNE
jgi:hypothetical protein